MFLIFFVFFEIVFLVIEIFLRFSFPVVLTPADLWYDTRFPRYCNPDFLSQGFFVTCRTEEEELRILVVGCNLCNVTCTKIKQNKWNKQMQE